MGLNAMLTVDLNNVTSEQRKKFYELLGKEQWKKINKLTTTWTASFNDNADYSGVISATKSDVKKCADSARITSYAAAVMVGKEASTVF